VEIKLKGRALPRDDKGDVKFVLLNGDPRDACACRSENQLQDVMSVLAVFTPEEVTELVNRAIYQIEYQRLSHRKRQEALREVERQLKAAGKDVKA
jgi:hypothetical protein